MEVKRLYDNSKGPMRVAGFMSGSGSNLIRIIENQMYVSCFGSVPYHVAVIFSNNKEGKAEEIGRRNNIPIIVNDIKDFYAKRGKPLRDMEARREYDAETVELIKPFNVDAIAYAGYMSIVTAPLLSAFLGVNVHPADLSVLDAKGRRKYMGDGAVAKALADGSKEIRATTHLMTEEVDGGQILMVSKPLIVEPGVDAEEHQSRLKQVGDLEIFPLTLRYISEGKYQMDGEGRVYFEGKEIPDGFRL